jgi:hypothetical protein
MVKKLSILDALASVTAQDLVALDAQIVTAQKELDTLTEARKLINVKLNGKPAKQPKAPGKKSAPAIGSTGPIDPKGLAAQAAKVLGSKGVMSIAKLAESLGANYQTIYTAIRKAPGFEQTDKGVLLTPQGKQLYGIDS